MSLSPASFATRICHSPAPPPPTQGPTCNLAIPQTARRSQKRSWLFLGSYLSLGVWSLLASSFLGRLLGTPIFHSIEVYFGLAVFMGERRTTSASRRARGSRHPRGLGR